MKAKKLEFPTRAKFCEFIAEMRGGKGHMSIPERRDHAPDTPLFRVFECQHSMDLAAKKVEMERIPHPQNVTLL